MVDAALQNAWVLYCINKDKGDESLPLLAILRDVINAIFLKYSKEGRSSSSYVGNRNAQTYVCYDDTKYYQVPLKNKTSLR